MYLSNTSAYRLSMITLLVLITLCVCGAKVAAEDIALSDQQPTLSARLVRSDSWPQGDVAVILHGTLSHRDTEIIQSLESLLGDEGVSTLAINLSLGVEDRKQALPCDGPHRHRESDASIELARWSAWLTTQGVREFTAIGHSRGANQIARYVLDTADPLAARLILIAPPQWSSQKTQDAYRDRHGKPLTTLLAQAQEQSANERGDALLPGNLGLLYCQNTRATAASFLSYYSDDPLRDTPTLIAGISRPVLVIAGSEDEVASGLPTAIAERAPRALVEEIDGADHFFRDLYADELVEIAIDFMHDE
ncbi:alpha/beta hydrolase [Congregibacter variabilis]|uniref:Alpha/beta hydrolase n=1 Tax=Congregibacter variabilis TaxID=3081200 RepID=A0ABZ0I0J8_9GAMM|nr:alpha/beta hydrolase [Congregibacter sp. IMCC43200]